MEGVILRQLHEQGCGASRLWCDRWRHPGPCACIVAGGPAAAAGGGGVVVVVESLLERLQSAFHTWAVFCAFVAAPLLAAAAAAVAGVLLPRAFGSVGFCGGLSRSFLWHGVATANNKDTGAVETTDEQRWAETRGKKKGKKEKRKRGDKVIRVRVSACCCFCCVFATNNNSN